MGNLKNFATALVATAPSPATSGTSLIVTATKGVRYPEVPFYATAHPQNQVPTLDNAEAVQVTDVSTDTFTIVRAQKGTTAQAITTDFRISNTIFTEDMFNGSVVENEIPGGAVNGSNTAFTIATAGKVTGTLKVYQNGIRFKASGNDFTETATGFTMTTAPATGTVLLVDYRVGGTSDYSVGTNSSLPGETPAGAVNSSNTVYTLARPYIAGSLRVVINGLRQKGGGVHFTETNPSAGTFTMSDAPQTGDDIMVDSDFNLNPSSNADTVDGIHASATPVANQLLALNSSAEIPRAALGTRYKIGTNTISATGDVTISGLGFTPKLIRFYPWSTQAASSTLNVAAGWGMADDSLTQFAYTGVTRNTHGGKTTHTNSSCVLIQSIAAGGGSAADNLNGSLTSVNAGGFVVNISVYSALGTMGFDWVAEG